MSQTKNPLWNYLEDGVIANGNTQYIQVPIIRGTIGCHIGWIDATSSATITLELTSFPPEEAANGAAAGFIWKDSGVSITGPTASAAASSLVNVENCRQSRARLKVVAAANTSLVIYNGDQVLG